jgi:signal transduction histidine kinase/CheY-like chemotaxis protein
MAEFFRQLFSNAFMPHRMCFLDDTATLWLHVISDALIALSYYVIPILLFRFVRQRRDIGFPWIFVAFGMFILACGTSHVLGAVTVFNPVYRIEGLVKAVTAVASISTFLLLIPAMPALISLPSPSALQSANDKLAIEIDEKRRVEATVRHLNEELEHRVANRTADLERALVDLQQEMKRRDSLEKQLIQSQKMEAIGRLAGGVAHDFNNLLTVILGHGEMLRFHFGDDPAADDGLREIQRAGERASALTQQLLAFSRRQIAMVRVVDLNEAVLQTEKMLRRLIGEDVGLALHLTSELPHIKIDPSHIDQILLNLAVNARDAMPNGGTMTLETARVNLDEQYATVHDGISPGPHVMLAVSDTGTGMDEATKVRVFEPFFTTKEAGKGTGLGLSIVYGIVKQNGGEILVYSELGQGTVFKILFPAATAVAENTAAAPEVVTKRPASETIMLVEDDPQVRNIARAMLERLGYSVITCASPDEAQTVLRAQSGKVALLLTDIIMPGMRGTELAASAKSTNPEIRVLFMSGYTEGGVLDQGMITADMPFLRKPFTAGDLEKEIRAALYGDSGQALG